MFSTLILTSITESQNEWDENWMEEQICLAGQGDNAALEQIYRYTSSSMYAFLLSILKNRYDAEDALQDTYVGIFHSASGYRPNHHSKAWLFTIARNQAMMRFREQRRFVSDAEEILELYPVQDHSQQAQDRLLLNTALKSLGSEESQIVILHAVAGFKHRETARLMGLPLNTVISKYHRSLKLLKQILKEGEADA